MAPETANPTADLQIDEYAAVPESAWRPLATASPAVPLDSPEEFRRGGWMKAGQVSRGAFLRELQDLEALREGWDGYDARPVDPAVVQAARDLIDRMPSLLLWPPHIAPLSSGGIQLEWAVEGRELEFEFESPNSIRYLKWYESSEEGEEDDVRADDSEQIARLFVWLTRG